MLAAAATISAFAQNLLAQANAALQAGEADRALALLNSLPSSGEGQAEAHNLQCRVRLTLEQWNAAVSQCEQAVRLDGQNSGYHLWLGRALGKKAERASFLRAYSLAKRVRAEFEESVRLNPRNAEALEALGEYDLQAPGIVGGGVDKAQGIAAQLDKVDAARAHELRGRIAEERKDYGTAEREFKLAVAAGAHPAFQWTTLAGFYSRRQRWTEMESALRSVLTAARRDKHAATALYDGAGVLTESKRDPLLASKMLEDYLAGSAKTEDAPAFVAHDRLARIEDQLGDAAAARRERAAALALAHDYKPAQQAGAQEARY
ncbi:MAG: tetratricopeptide repeat protein [Bryobacteraceae bacterium]